MRATLLHKLELDDEVYYYGCKRLSWTNSVLRRSISKWKGSYQLAVF